MLTHLLQHLGDPVHLLAHEVPMALILAWALVRRQRRGEPCHHCEAVELHARTVWERLRSWASERAAARTPIPPRRFPFVDMGQPWLCPFCAETLVPEPVGRIYSILICPGCGARENQDSALERA